MNKNELRSIIQELVEQKAPALSIDLWPAIQTSIKISHPRSSRQGWNTHYSPLPKRGKLAPALILGAVMLVGALFLLLPQGRALAQGSLRYFTRIENNLIPGVTVAPGRWIEQTPGFAAAGPTVELHQPTPPGLAFESTCGSLQAPLCTIAAIRNMVDFPVFALAQLPAGMTFTGATGSPDRVILIYSTLDPTERLTIWQEPRKDDGSDLSWEVGASADIQPIQIGAVTGEYVKGTYMGTSSPPVWDSEAEVQTIRWLDQEVLINMILDGAASRLDRDGLAALAASLTDGPQNEDASVMAATATPVNMGVPFDPRTDYPLTLEQVKEKAGFTPIAPALLPERVTFTGANFEEITKVLALSYAYIHPNPPEGTDAVIIREQFAPQSTDCDLCGFIQGDGKQVEQYPHGKLVSKDATLETVKIGSLTGQYLEGIGWVSWIDCCGWQWDPHPYTKRLRFRTSELAIEISSYTDGLSKEDVIGIAENLK